MPDHRTIREHKNLKFFGQLLHDPNLWHLNRHSVSGACSVGLFVAFVPIPFQMVLAAALAILFRLNLPISATLVWVTNPFTIPPIYYLAYKTGAWILQEPTRNISFELSFHWLMTKLAYIWEPFLLGCFLFGTICAIAGNLVMRGLWRLHVIKSWQARKLRRLQKKSPG